MVFGGAWTCGGSRLDLFRSHPKVDFGGASDEHQGFSPIFQAVLACRRGVRPRFPDSELQTPVESPGGGGFDPDPWSVAHGEAGSPRIEAKPMGFVEKCKARTPKACAAAPKSS